MASDWASASAVSEFTHRAGPPADYKPGEFYRRELPLLLAVLTMLPRPPEVIVIDAYVWLDEAGRKGLGAHLHEAIAEAAAVVGVAKTRFANAGRFAEKVRRGHSISPLWITSAGIERRHAANAVRRMHGRHRLPDLIQHADRLARRTLQA